MTPRFFVKHRQTVRLSRTQNEQILQIVRELVSPDVDVRIFNAPPVAGSWGARVDLLVSSPAPVEALTQARTVRRLQEALSMSVDLVFSQQGRESTAFLRTVRRRTRPLGEDS